MTAPSPIVTGFYDPRTFSIQYVVACPATRRCAIVDPVLDFDEKSGATATLSADAILAHVREAGLEVEWILDTHPHADHFSAADYLKRKTGAPTAIGARICDVQALWQRIYDWPELACDGSQWDRLLADGDTFRIGAMAARVMLSPGHTLASITYVIGDAAFVHDTLFMPDSGTARCDFPGGDAGTLYESIQAILALPDTTRLFTGHDYQPGGRPVRFESTVAEQKATSIHLAGRPSRARFVEVREARDRTLPMPRLILHALQVNLQAGRFPAANAAGDGSSGPRSMRSVARRGGEGPKTLDRSRALSKRRQREGALNIERLTLYHYPATRSARVKWLLHELGEAFEVVRVALYEREQYEPAFLALNPNHAVPTLRIDTDGDRSIAMFESGAIITMLADLHPERRLAPPPSPFSPARADYLQTIHFCGAAIDMMLWQIRVHLHILPAAEQHEATIVRYRTKFADEVEPQLRGRLTAASHICGEAFCAADCMVGHAVMWAQRYGLCDDPAFRAYLTRLSERPAFRQAFADARDFTPRVPESAGAKGRFSG